MSTATIDGLQVHYQVFGSGAPLLLFAPGGFDATIEKWRAASAWTGIDALEALATRFQVIAYDRRESGKSGGRVERLSWHTYARQAKVLLDQLKIDSALLLGGCMGCSVALAFAVDYPEATRALLLHWPVGGFRWKASGLDRFQRHYRFASTNGLAGVNERARIGKSFWTDPEAGPWASVIAREPTFAEDFIRQDLNRYLGLIAVSGRGLFDRDTATGAEPEEIMGISAPAFIVPGDDASHATSAAHYLRELLPNASFWNVPPTEQTTREVCDRILEFSRQLS
ncbi:MAG TPA: alpha/beta hydrolase [Candidatus Binatia bacterium]